MRLKLSIIASPLLALLASCGGGNGDLQNPRRVTMEAVYGSSLEGVELSQAGDALTISYSEVPAGGRMVRLNLPEGTVPDNQSWSGDESTLHLVAPAREGIEIGVVPTEGYGGESVKLELTLANGSRSTSLAPVGAANVITDLSINSSTFGFVDLEWTQMNVGDYDLNGEVNISDLTPLAPRLNTAIDRAAPGAKLETAYWVDGDRNGEINISDITPIGANYQSQVYGYKIKQNGTEIPGEQNGDPTVLAATAEKRAGLPNRYHVSLTGLSSDTWVVTPVDSRGNAGADSSGNPGSAPADLNVSLDIIGLGLRDLATGDEGSFGPGKFSTRVIDPIDVVYRTQIGNSTSIGTSSVLSNLPRNKVLIVDFRFAPVVNLLTGAPKGGSSFKGTSAVADADIVQESVIFELPEAAEPGHIDTVIEAAEKPEGGYVLTMTSTIAMPGDDPNSPAVENGYTDTQVTQVDWANGTVARDTDGDGSFANNPKVGDPDRDGVGENERKRFAEFDDRDDRNEAEEMGIVGTVKTLDFWAGTITLTGVADNGEHQNHYLGDSEFTFDFTEVGQFLIRTDANNDGVIVDPAMFNIGDSVEVDMYPALDGTYWVEKVKRDDRTHGGGGGGGKGGGGED
jgi:hypothetical protein